MIIYNVTSIIADDIREEFVSYMQNTHMPAVMATGKFDSCIFLQLTEPVNEGFTYCAQYITDKLSNLNEFRQRHSEELQDAVQQKFGEKQVVFRSILEKV